MKPPRESDGAPTPRKMLNRTRGSLKCDIRKHEQQAGLVHTHQPRASRKSTAGGAKHRTQELST
jgi:hypothetical protein